MYFGGRGVISPRISFNFCEICLLSVISRVTFQKDLCNIERDSLFTFSVTNY